MTKITRIVLYSHDTMGLGHMRRNLLLSHAIASSRLKPVILTIVGRPEARRFPLPPRSDRVVIPALRKRPDGKYEAHRLGVPLAEIIAIRSNVICAAVEAFDPDLMIVDNVPRGAVRELDRTLAALKKKERARVVLGLRDVLDDPEQVTREWKAADNFSAIRDWYDSVWVYGDPIIFDSLSEYRFPADIARRMRYTGYFDQRSRLETTPAEEFSIVEKLGLSRRQFVLCLLGGGEDGTAVAEAFGEIDLPEDLDAVIVTGPYLPQRVVRRLKLRAQSDGRFHVVEFIPEPAVLISRASAVVMMGGYNTVWEVVCFGKRALIIPRVKPRTEQLIRARKLESLALVDVLLPLDLSPARLSSWVREPVRSRANVSDLVKLDGLDRLRQFVTEVIASPAFAKHRGGSS